jgi:hypothetical protein
MWASRRRRLEAKLRERHVAADEAVAIASAIANGFVQPLAGEIEAENDEELRDAILLRVTAFEHERAWMLASGEVPPPDTAVICSLGDLGDLRSKLLGSLMGFLEIRFYLAEGAPLGSQVASDWSTYTIHQVLPDGSSPSGAIAHGRGLNPTANKAIALAVGEHVSTLLGRRANEQSSSGSSSWFGTK